MIVRSTWTTMNFLCAFYRKLTFLKNALLQKKFSLFFYQSPIILKNITKNPTGFPAGFLLLD
jgi:hypothetical protein